MTTILFILIILIALLAFFGVVKAKIPTAIDDYAEDLRSILKTKPYVLGGFAIIIVVISLFNGIYFTNEQEIGFSSIFGRNTIIETAGMHFKVPFLSKKHVFDGTTQGIPIGYSLEDDESVYEDSLMITSDFNFINIDFYLEYHITDPIAYYYSTNDPEGILKNIALASIRNTVGQVDVDSAMTTGKSQIEADVFADITAELSKHSTGLTVTNISIQDSEAPTKEVADAFQEVEDAKQGAKTAVNTANKYTNEQIPAAEAAAAKIKSSAEATRTERINQATEEVATFEALYAEYSKNPDIVKQRMYLDALSEIIPQMEIIIGKDSKVVYVTGSGDVSSNTDVAGSN